MKTVTRQANQLSAGDVIVDPDGNRHEVTAVTVHGLSAAWLTFTTDTGLTHRQDPRRGAPRYV